MTKWIIGFGTPANMPGPGCADNDFLREVEFEGTEAEAEEARLKISYEDYFGDAHSWIERVNPLEQEAKYEPKQKRLILVSGPSGVGKGPIIEWTKKLYLPTLAQVKVRKTPTERHTGLEDELGFDGHEGEYYQFKCRGVKQRIYLNEIDSALEKNDFVLIESYYKTLDFLQNKYSSSVDFVSVFISPLNKKDIKVLAEQGKTLKDYLPDLMLDSLIRRAEKEGKDFTRKLNRELEQRAEDSLKEMNSIPKYDLVIPNHCYEFDSRWTKSSITDEPADVVYSLTNIIKTGNNYYAFRAKYFLK
jgi:hypothetical protein